MKFCLRFKGKKTPVNTMQLLAVRYICLKRKASPMGIPLQTRNTSCHDPKPCVFFLYKGVPQFRPTVQALSQQKDFLLLPIILTPINLYDRDPSLPSRHPFAGCSPDSRVQDKPLPSSHQGPQCWAQCWCQLPAWVNHELPQLEQAHQSYFFSP